MKHNLKGNYNTREVWLDGELLDPKPSQTIRNHSPDGFSWGYGGSGCAQLALAIMLELTTKPDGYQEFKWNVISIIPQTDFDIEFTL
jgi:hypothetical protein